MNYKLRFLAIFLLLLFCSKSNAQAPPLQWSKYAGGSLNQLALDCAVDSFGNVYTIGYFEGTVDFDPGTGTQLLTAINLDVFILKINSSGNLVWVKQISGDSLSSHYGNTIALDPQGNIYAAGVFLTTTDFDPGPGTFNLTANGVFPSFILKLNSAGNFVWVKAFDGVFINDGPVEPNSMAIDNAGNILTTGRFIREVDFDPGAGTYILPAVFSPSPQAFITKIDSSGNFVWAKAISKDSATITGLGISTDVNGNVYSFGHFNRTADFDPGGGVVNLTSVGGTNAYLLKLNSAGNFVWVKSFGKDSTSVESITVGTDGIYFTGYFHGMDDFDPGASTFNLTSGIYNDAFISKLDTLGNFLWAKQLSGNDFTQGNTITIDSTDAIYLSGQFGGTADFDPGAGTATLYSSWYDVFVLKLNSNGNYLWAKSVPSQSLNEIPGAIAVYSPDNLFVTGYTGNASGPDVFLHHISWVPGSVNENNVSTSATVFPNPATERLTIAFGSTGASVGVTIIDLAGEVVYSTTTNSAKLEINVSRFAAGAYFIQLQTPEFVETKKIFLVK